MKSLLCLAVLAALTGCASITGSKTQSVSVATTANDAQLAGASCTLQNDEGKWLLTSPGSVVVRKSTADMSIDCILNNGFGGNATSVSRANMAVWGNILIGGVIGYVVDRQTGAGFDYPSSIVVPLQAYAAGNAPFTPASASSAGMPSPVASPVAAVAPAYMPRQTRSSGVLPMPAGYVPRSTMASQ